LDPNYFSPKPKDEDDQNSQPLTQNPNRTLLNFNSPSHVLSFKKDFQ